MNLRPAATFLEGRDTAMRLAEEHWMTDADYARKIDEVDRLLNDPDVPMEPSRIWSLLAEIATLEQSASKPS